MCRQLIVLLRLQTAYVLFPVADPKILKRGEDNLSAPSSFIAYANNEIYAFYTENAAFWKKYDLIGGRLPPPPPWIRHWLFPHFADGSIYGSLTSVCFWAPTGFYCKGQKKSCGRQRNHGYRKGIAARRQNEGPIQATAGGSRRRSPEGPQKPMMLGRRGYRLHFFTGPMLAAPQWANT